MAVYYFDTSALVKRYLTEVGSNWVRAITDPTQGNDIYIAGIAGPEAVSAFVRQTTPLANLTTVLADFKSDFQNQYQTLSLASPIIATAMHLAETYRLRGYDAVQLAAAVELHRLREAASLPPLVFVCADQQLNRSALAESLQVDDPNHHP